MVDRPSMGDFEGEDGKVDWNAYDKAKKAYREQEVKNGDYCYQCGAHILFGGKGYQQSCSQCSHIYESSSLSHERFVRCPYCRHTFNPAASDYYELYEEGEHTVTCGMCDKEYEISTRIQHTFSSPAFIGDNEDEEENEETDEEE